MDPGQPVFFDSEMMKSLDMIRWCESLESLKVVYFTIRFSSHQMKVESVIFCREVKMKIFV